jgi:uncharacterized alpha-E superfamily protein
MAGVFSKSAATGARAADYQSARCRARADGHSTRTAKSESCLEVLLQIADSSITYRTRHLTDVRAEYVLELLLADEANPRSVAFQLVELLEQIQHLPGRDTDASESPEQKLISKALGSIRQAWMADLAKRDAEGKLGALGELSPATARHALRFFRCADRALSQPSDAIAAAFVVNRSP